MIEQVLAAIGAATADFEPDELAYLALTSKVEAPIRDRLAFALSRAAGPSGGRVAREYRRADIAWLHGKVAKAIVELKACYSFDLISQPAVYAGHVKADLDKATLCGGRGCASIGVLLATHPRNAVPREYYDTIKYAGKVNASIKQNGSADVVRVIADRQAKAELGKLGTPHSLAYPLGAYLGVGVDLLFWVVEARP